MRGNRKIIPDLLLRNWQDVKLRIKALRHEGTFEEPLPVSSLVPQATTGRARTPRNDR
jgi:hypothetical protein